jgi:hypothetical protein
VIVDCLHQFLPRTHVSFCNFHRPVAEQKLDLFKFPSCGMTQPCASPTQVVRRQIIYAREFRVFTNDPPDRFLTEAVTTNVSENSVLRELRRLARITGQRYCFRVDDQPT